MKHIILLLAAILSINNAHAQWWSSNKSIKGNGQIITKIYSTSGYDKISGKNNIDITIVKGKEGTITVEAESNIMEHLEIEVKDNRLEIVIEDGYHINTRKRIKVTVPVEKISGLSMAGSGDITSNIKLKSRELYISVAGSGDINVAVASERLHVSVSGSGEVKVSGRTEHLEATVAGSGGIAGFNLKAKHVDASIDGSGDISVFCMGGELQASIVGSGDLRYKGTTSRVKKSIMGSGDITKM
ncbi:MAG: head GIN domain-containing protein [Nonlabens sp.]|uniref:head GIN domain-containing protein n=1 Tax=Nonlabens sp. TaxID=1888209 RepID=UPI0035A69634